MGSPRRASGTLLKKQIPIRTFQEWNDVKPGFLEADLVAHCGTALEGSLLYTLTLTDIATGWTELLPLLSRTQDAVIAALKRAQHLLPFPILGIDTDNGAECINVELLTFCEQEEITFTRGRPKREPRPMLWRAEERANCSKSALGMIVSWESYLIASSLNCTELSGCM